MNKQFLRDAIADAKTVKESAIANAKAALEEAFSPHLRSMLSKKLEEMEGMDEEDGELDELFNSGAPNEYADDAENLMLSWNDEEEEPFEKDFSNSEFEDDDFDLDGILAEIESEEEESKGKSKEPKKPEPKKPEPKKPESKKSEPKKPESDEEDEDDEFNLEDMTDEDLKELIKDVISDMKASGELEDGGEVEDEEFSLDMEDDEDLEGGDFSLSGGNKSIGGGKSIGGNKGIEKPIKENPSFRDGIYENQRLKTQIEEAKKVINMQRKDLFEINLLNSKLLYMNKIYKAKMLNEAQKSKVLEAFDKANTVKEVKIIYNTLNENIKNPKPTFNKKNIIGSASKMRRAITENKQSAPIMESNEMVKRFQKLAGII